MSDELLILATRFATALSSFERDHDFGVIWDHDARSAAVTVGPNALMGFPYASGQAEHLNRFEGIVLAMEAAAKASMERTAGLDPRDARDDDD